MKQSILFLALTIILSLNSCKDKSKDPQPPKPIEETQSPVFSVYNFKGRGLRSGIIMRDSLQKEIVFASGNSNSNGELISIDQMVAYIPKIQTFINYKFNKDNLVESVTTTSKTSSKTFEFSGLNISLKTVKVRVVDNSNGVKIFEDENLPVSDETIELIQEAMRVGKELTNGRTSAVECFLVPYLVRFSIAYVTCWLTTRLQSEICTAPQGGENLEMFQDCKSVTNETAIPNCEVANKYYTDIKYRRDCKEMPTDEEWEEHMDCLQNSTSSSLSWEEGEEARFKCVDDLMKKLEEREKENEEEEKKNEKSGGGWGDPHLTTTDNLYYDFHGFGEFIILKSTVDNFEIQGRHETYLNLEHASMTTALAIQTGVDIVSIHTNPLSIFVNNEKLGNPSGIISLKNGASISVQGKDVNITTSAKDVIEIDAYGIYLNYSLYLSSSRHGKVEGLLGNFDGNKENDLRIKGGDIVKNEFANLYPKFSDSWRVSANFLLHYESGKNTATYTRKDLPKPVPTYSDVQRQAARKVCTDAGITSEPYLSSCIFDQLTTNNPEFVKGYIDLVREHPLNPSAPANDEYSGAINLPINNGYSCANAVSGTTNGATKSLIAACPGERVDDDVWFKFTATTASHVLKISDLQHLTGKDTYRNVQVFQSANNAPGESILCAAMTMEEKFLTGLKVGSTYFVRISSWGENTRLNFKLCISTPPAPPANDEYTGAVDLSVNQTIDCKINTAATTNGATKSSTPFCQGERADDDVWFKFTASASSHVLKISDLQAAHGNNNYRNVQIFQAVNNAPGESILCAAMTMEEKFLTGLKVGSPYFIRISSWQENVRLNFKLCVSTPPVPPSNDEHTGAVTLVVNPNLEVKNVTSGTTHGATKSSTPFCQGERVDDDVWFRFTATSSSHLLKLTDLQAAHGASNYRNVQVLQAVNNVPGESILCAAMTMEEKFLTGLKPGSNYFIRVSSWSENVRLNFKLCVLTPPESPSNDEYAGAIALLVNSGKECTNETSATTLGATKSLTALCQGERVDDDVWFKFTANASSHRIKISEVKSTYGESIYRNVQVLQAVNNSPATNKLCKAMTAEDENLSGLTVGAVYFIRVSSWSENSRISFKICVASN